MRSDWHEEKLRELAQAVEAQRKEEELNPLSKYSTMELKKELRRRKKMY